MFNGVDGVGGEGAEPAFLAGDGGNQRVGEKDLGVALDFAGGGGEDVGGALIGFNEVGGRVGPQVEVAREIG